MTDQRKYLYSLVRYVPDVIGGEYVNIGALVRDPDVEGCVSIRFTTDWSRLRVMFPEADVELLEAVAVEVAANIQEVALSEGTSLVATMDSWSNCIQLTESKGMYAESLESGLDHLFYLHVGSSSGQPSHRAAEAS